MAGSTARYGVLLTPDVNAGWAGWCFVATGANGGGCDGAQYHALILAEAWNGSHEPPKTVGVAVTTAEVARVGIGDGSGRSVPTIAERTLPEGLRAVVINTDQKLTGAGGGFPQFVPLTANGAVIPQSPGETTDALLQPIPTRELAHPANPSRGICEIKITGHPQHLSANSGTVVTQVRGYAGIVGDGFITCASTAYELAGWPLLATVLISASHPGGRPPAIPGMRPLLGHSGGVVTVSMGGTPAPENEAVARPFDGGWLMVSRSKTPQRLALLEHLSVALHL